MVKTVLVLGVRVELEHEDDIDPEQIVPGLEYAVETDDPRVEVLGTVVTGHEFLNPEEEGATVCRT